MVDETDEGREKGLKMNGGGWKGGQMAAQPERTTWVGGGSHMRQPSRLSRPVTLSPSS